LKICGVDMTKPDAVKSTLDRFAEQVAQVERLIS
jgi:oligoendopeptidase F